MRWLWTLPLLAPLLMACNSSNGNSCSTAGGVCTFGSCNPYCANGSCSTPLPTNAQDCPTSSVTAAGVTNTGNPCCVTEQTVASTTPPTPSPDAGQTEDATVSDDATVGADSSVPTDGSHDGAGDEDTGTLTCPLVEDAGDSGLRMCLPDGGTEDSGATDAPSDG